VANVAIKRMTMNKAATVIEGSQRRGHEASTVGVWPCWAVWFALYTVLPPPAAGSRMICCGWSRTAFRATAVEFFVFEVPKVLPAA